MKSISLKEAPKTRYASTKLNSNPANIDREGGLKKAGLIEGVSLIMEGEALGHDMWIDSEMVEQTYEALSEAGSHGVKVRFTHPGASSDGMGKMLGRVNNASMSDGKVYGDLHFSRSAHKTPDGNLAEYVMDLAEEDSDAFGMSIVFERDIDAENQFRKDNTSTEEVEDRYGNYEREVFSSPDYNNTRNLRHARLAVLKASDVVDEPAANKDGLFHVKNDILTDAERLMDYATGKTDEEPHLSSFDSISPVRIKGFLTRYLSNNGLEIVKTDFTHNIESDALSEPKKETMSTPTQEPQKAEKTAPANEIATLSADQIAEYEALKAEKAEREAEEFAQAQKEAIAEEVKKQVAEFTATKGIPQGQDTPASPSNSESPEVASYDSLYQSEVVAKEGSDAFGNLKLAQAFKAKHGTKSEYNSKHKIA